MTPPWPVRHPGPLLHRAIAGPLRLLGLCVLACTLITSCHRSVGDGIERANDLLYHQKYVDAERLYRKLLHRLDAVKEPSEADEAQRLLVLDRLGKINGLYLRDYTQAIADYEVLIRRYPGNDAALSALWSVADLYTHKLADLHSAIGAYQRLVSQFGHHTEAPKALLEVVSCYFRLKDYNQVRLEADTLCQRYPNTAEAAQARFEMANAYYVQRRYTEAIATYEAVLSAKPDPELGALVDYELGNCYQELGQTARALGSYYAALSHHPSPKLVQSKIVRVRARLHQTRPAAKIANAAVILPIVSPVQVLPPQRLLKKKSVQQSLSEVEIGAFPSNNARLPELPAESQPQEPTEALAPSESP